MSERLKITATKKAKSNRMLFIKVKKIFFNLALLLLFLSPFNSYSLANEKNLEYKVKAAYLYNFTKFIHWPSDILSSKKDDTLNICILGQDPFGHAIDLLINKTVQGYNVSVKYIDNVNTGQQCHVTFISKSKEKDVIHILDVLSKEKTLTVSDIESFTSKGGCISLDVLKGKVRFNVNLQAAQNANLKISAKLLELAKRVIE